MGWAKAEAGSPLSGLLMYGNKVTEGVAGLPAGVVAKKTQYLGHFASDPAIWYTGVAVVNPSDTTEAMVDLDILYPVVVNHPEICDLMLPALKKAAGEDKVFTVNPVMGAEDFSFFLNEIPGMFFFLGIRPDGMDDHEVAANHSPLFQVNERALITGVRAFSYMVLEYARNHHQTEGLTAGGI